MQQEIENLNNLLAQADTDLRKKEENEGLLK